MIFVILIIISLFVFVSIYSKKFNSPYTLSFIFGKKGAGKSTYMIVLMIRYLKKGYTIYTDMRDVNIDGVRIFSLRDLSKHTPPPRSAVFLDETGLSMNNRDWKMFSEGLREWYALQRKYQCVVYANSQTWDLEKSVRERCDQFFFVQKMFGFLSLIRPIVLITRPNDMSSPDCDSPVKPTYRWGSLFAWKFIFLPRYAKYFNSFAAPERPEVPYEEVVSDFILDRPNRFLSWLNKRRR